MFCTLGKADCRRLVLCDETFVLCLEMKPKTTMFLQRRRKKLRCFWKTIFKGRVFLHDVHSYGYTDTCWQSNLFWKHDVSNFLSRPGFSSTKLQIFTENVINIWEQKTPLFSFSKSRNSCAEEVKNSYQTLLGNYQVQKCG